MSDEDEFLDDLDDDDLNSDQDEQKSEENQKSRDENNLGDDDRFFDFDNIDDVDDEDENSGYDPLKRLMTAANKPKKKVKTKKSEFIDDEAELSGDDEVSEDELDFSDEDDQVIAELVDQEAKELSSEEEEEVRRLYHKQLETEDKRTVLLLQEQLQDNEIAIGQGRRRKFRWQNEELMETSLKRHYDPDDEDSLDDEDDIDYSDLNPRLKRPTAESILIGSTRLRCTTTCDDSQSPRGNKSSTGAGPSNVNGEDSNSQNHINPSTSTVNGSLNRFLFRDKEIVQALSTKEVIVNTREEKDRLIQRELKRVAQSKSIFDQLY